MKSFCLFIGLSFCFVNTQYNYKQIPYEFVNKNFFVSATKVSACLVASFFVYQYAQKKLIQYEVDKKQNELIQYEVDKKQGAGPDKE